MGDFFYSSLGSITPRVFRLGLSATYRPGTRTVMKAIDQGIRYFFLLGFDNQMIRVLRDAIGREREQFVIATGAYNLIWTHQNLRRTLDRRLKQLGTGYIDVFPFLGVTRPKHFTGGVREELAAVRQDGRVRGVSISCHDPEFAADLLRDGALDAIMIRYNAANRSAESAVFPAARAQGAGVVAYTATAWGRLLRPAPDRADAPPTAGMCYRFSLSHPDVDVCLTAPRSLEEFEANLNELRRGPLAAEELEFMRRFGDAVRPHLLRR